MFRKYTIAILSVCALSLLAQACRRFPEKSPLGAGQAEPQHAERSQPGPNPGNTTSAAPAPTRRPSTDASQSARPLPVDRFVGEHPGKRLVPDNFQIGPLQDLRFLPDAPDASAAEAARTFLEGLREGRVTATVSRARSVIVFMLADILAQDHRVTRWCLGRGTPTPDGAYSFPVLLETASGRIRGELFTAHPPGEEWGVELAILDTESDRASPEKQTGAFDPTIRGARKTGR